MVLWTQVVTARELDRDDVVRVLDATTWQQRRQRLQELAGTDWFPDAEPWDVVIQ